MSYYANWLANLDNNDDDDIVETRSELEQLQDSVSSVGVRLWQIINRLNSRGYTNLTDELIELAEELDELVEFDNGEWERDDE